MKWRFFKHLLGGGDPDSERVYRWHIAERSGARMQAGLSTDRWKRSLDDYVAGSTKLAKLMVLLGFLPDCAVPIDPAGELLDGSHRVACALALGVEEIPVRQEPRHVWAPPWDRAWFKAHGMPPEDFDRLRADWALMRRDKDAFIDARYDHYFRVFRDDPSKLKRPDEPYALIAEAHGRSWADAERCGFRFSRPRAMKR